jgi:hypothetical protein
MNGLRTTRQKPTELNAGPLRMQFVSGELRYVCCGAVEVLRRVSVAVRDCHWGTVPLHLSNLGSESREAAFRVSFTAMHQRDEIDFRWQGIITGDAQGTLRFTMDGVAHSGFLRNRIGLCVLHPPECAGRACRVEHTDGAREDGFFPRFIAPHQPFKDIRAITHEVAPGLSAEIRLSGDVFEMEDHRNWTDGSFKTYGTPLALTFPVAVKTGERMVQEFTLSLGGAGWKPAPPPRPTTIAVKANAATPLPHIGLGAASHEQPLSETDLTRLRALNLSHLRVDLVLSQPEYPSTLARAVAAAQALKLQLEVALFLFDNAAAELREVRQMAEQLDAPIARWLIFHPAEKVTAAKWLALARETFGTTAVLGAGTNQYFAELNRQRPLADYADVICYSINPQVHATDEDALVEALAAQAATVESARQFIGDKPIAISPVTLKPRFNPHIGLPASLLPTPPDARQASLFAAAWTLGSVKYLAESGVASVTYFETIGARGVLEAASGSVFPMWHVLADVGEFAGGEVLHTLSDVPLKVVSLALRKATKLRLMLANVSGTTQPVCVELKADQAQMRRLNERNVAAATNNAERFRQRAPELLTLTQGKRTLTLSPNEIITLDCV